MLKFTPITHEPKITVSGVTAEFVKVVRQVADMIQDDLEKPTETWDEKPTFSQVLKIDQRQISIDILLAGDTPGNEHYTWLDEGTKKHYIMSDAKHMKFPGTFTAKTIPGILHATAGSKSEHSKFLPKSYPVENEIKARKFTEQVQEIWGKRFPDDAVQAINAIANKL